MRARPLPSSQTRPASFGDTAEALHTVRLLLEATTEQHAPIPFTDRLVAEARHFFRMSRAVLLRVAGVPGDVHVQVCATDPEGPRGYFFLRCCHWLGRAQSRNHPPRSSPP